MSAWGPLPRLCPHPGPLRGGRAPQGLRLAADGHLFQDSERAGHPGVLHGRLCGVPGFLPGRARRPPERGREGRSTAMAALRDLLL